jgi:hypothetical protein
MVADHILVRGLIAVAALTLEWTLSTKFILMLKEFISCDIDGAVATLDISKLTTLQLVLLALVQIEMFVELSQLSCPLATYHFVSTVDLEPIQWLLKSLVGKIVKVVLFATWAWVVLGFNSFNAHFTEALATACHLIRFSNDVQAHWTFSLKILGRIFYKFALESNLMFQYCHS